MRSIIVKGIGGMGNRVFAFLTASLYARLSDRRIIVDWRDFNYSDGRINSFFRYFRANVEDISNEVLVNESVAPTVWENRLHLSYKEVRSLLVRNGERRYLSANQLDTTIDITNLDYEEEIVVFWSYFEKINTLRAHFSGEFENLRKLSNWAILKQLFHESLVLHPDLQRRVDQFRRDFFSGETIGVHIRYTDSLCRLKSILKKLEHLHEGLSSPVVFIATDNQNIETMIRQKYNRVVFLRKRFPKTGQAMHKSARDKHQPVRIGEEALIDLYLLAACNHMILDGSSSFGRLAMMITKAPQENIHNVKFGRSFEPLASKLPDGLRIIVSWYLQKIRQRIY